jgi:hypothetical protein
VSVRVRDFEDFCVPGEEWPNGDFFGIDKRKSSSIFFHPTRSSGVRVELNRVNRVVKKSVS